MPGTQRAGRQRLERIDRRLARARQCGGQYALGRKFHRRRWTPAASGTEI